MSAEGIISFDPSAPQIGSPLFGAAVVTIGVFDGLHLGHRALLEASRKCAHDLGVKLLVVTFERDPDEVFCTDGSFARLLSNDDRLALLGEVTQSQVVVLPASKAVFGMTPESFLDALCSLCTPLGIFVGSNFRFGFRASGTVDDIDAWCALHACRFKPCELVEAGGKTVSSTRIRGLISQGHVDEASKLLARRPHSVVGRVVHGRGAGAALGFPTANIEPETGGACLPADGVYAGYAFLDEGWARPAVLPPVAYPAAINVGVPRTFAGADACLEAHLLGFSGDLYGHSIRLAFVEYLRPPRRFEGREDLIDTVEGNIAWVEQHLGASACRV